MTLAAPRALVAALLWVATLALVVVSHVANSTTCHPGAWVWLLSLPAGLCAAAGTAALLRTAAVTTVVLCVGVGAFVGIGNWFLLVASWVGGCTA